MCSALAALEAGGGLSGEARRLMAGDGASVGRPLSPLGEPGGESSGAGANNAAKASCAAIGSSASALVGANCAGGLPAQGTHE